MQMRNIRLVHPYDSLLSFEQVLEFNKNTSFFGKIKAFIFGKRQVVYVPLHLKHQYPAGMETLDGEPLWEYKLYEGQIYGLCPQYYISSL